MWAILKIYMGLVLLTIHVHGRYKNVMSDAIKTVIKERKYIDGIFAPVSFYPIGEGGFAAVFQGVNMAKNCDVAMKFSNHKERSKLEFLIRGYLKAIDNNDTQKSDVEKYGISPISYYYPKSQFESSSITVMPLYECDIEEKKYQLKVLHFEEIDYLILFRDYVRQTKYMHSCGVRYDDIKPKNIMLRKGRSFLIDFNASSKMIHSFNGYTMPYASRNAHLELERKNEDPSIIGRPLDDWESFIYVMALHMGVKLAWINKVKQDDSNAEEIGALKKNFHNTIKKIEDDVKFKKLKKIMVEFARVAFNATIRFPDYDHFDNIITAEINDINRKNKPKPAVFSWLKDHDLDEAIKDLMENPPTAAKDIKFEKTSFKKEDYVDMDEGFFSNRREEMAQMAATTGDLDYLNEKKKEFMEQKRGERSISRYIEETMIQPFIRRTCFKS